MQILLYLYYLPCAIRWLRVAILPLPTTGHHGRTSEKPDLTAAAEATQIRARGAQGFIIRPPLHLSRMGLNLLTPRQIGNQFKTFRPVPAKIVIPAMATAAKTTRPIIDSEILLRFCWAIAQKTVALQAPISKS